MDADVVGSFQKKVVQHPEVFFTPSEDIAQEIKGFTKHVFDHCTKFVSRTAATPLDQLYVDGFDADQIWEQLRLQNGPLLEELSKRIRSFQKKPEQIRLFPSEKDGQEEEDDEAMEVSEEVDEVDDDGEQESADSDDDQDDGEEEEQDDSAEKTPKKKVSKKTKKARDVAEDGFFDWDEMDRIAEEEEEEDDDDEDEGLGVDGLDGDDDDEEEGMDDDSEDDDMEDEDLDDESAAQMKFDDFFEEPDVKKSKRSRADDDEDEEEDDDDEEEEEEDEEEEEEDEEEDEFPTVNRTAAADVEGEVDEDELAERGIMSSHQRQRKRLQQEIKQLEKEALEDKPWELKGEVRSGARPENSLLEAVLDYDRPVKVAPVITVEVSVALEDMIKKRILEDDFDDVIRKFAPNEEDEKKKLLDVSMEKSKEGLGEIYEKEYMKTAMGFEADDESKQEQEEIEVMFKSLCWKLDALSNYQFTPKPMVKELQVKPSVPAIAMEEVVPISVSDANLKAPEEVFQKKRKRGEAVLQSKEEMTQDERKAQRGAKKRVRRKEKKQAEADERLVAKINPGLGNKYEKKKMLESIANAKNVTKGKEIEGSTKQFSNSKEFFSRLQEEVQGEIRKKKNAGAAT